MLITIWYCWFGVLLCCVYGFSVVLVLWSWLGCIAVWFWGCVVAARLLDAYGLPGCLGVLVNLFALVLGLFVVVVWMFVRLGLWW